MQMKQILSLGLVAAGLAGYTNAQPEPAPEPVMAQVEAWKPSWADDEIAKVADMLTGSWKTADAVSEWGNGADGSVQLVLQIAPVPVGEDGTMLYVEASRADQMDQPYRQTMFSLYRYKGNIRLRTYEFRMPESSLGAMVGLWAAPEFFPPMTRDDLIATLDVELSPASGGYAGSTPYPYPTGVGGAVEMTSHVELKGDTMVTADRGFDADGNVVWGADQGGQWVWNRVENPARVQHLDKGVIAIDFVRPEGRASKSGDHIFVHYSGWTTDGNMFDSSRPRNSPFDLTFPSPGRLIEGWNVGLGDMTVGTKRRLIIPSDAGYGVRGQPRANIPPNATLLFEVEMMDIQDAKPAAAAPAPAGAAPKRTSTQPGHEGHDHP